MIKKERQTHKTFYELLSQKQLRGPHLLVGKYVRICSENTLPHYPVGGTHILSYQSQFDMCA